MVFANDSLTQKSRVGYVESFPGCVSWSLCCHLKIALRLCLSLVYSPLKTFLTKSSFFFDIIYEFYIMKDDSILKLVIIVRILIKTIIYIVTIKITYI